MNDKSNLRRKRMFIPTNERFLTMSLALLLAGQAHGLTGEGSDDIAEHRDLMFQEPLATDIHTIRHSLTIVAQETNGEAADAKANDAPEQLDGSTIPPQESYELFNSDIAESAAEEEGSASERDLFVLGFSSLSTTDDFDARTASLSYRNHRREWFWPWQEATIDTLDWGLDVEYTNGEISPIEFESYHVQGTLGAYLTQGTYFEAQVGRHNLQTDLGDRTVTSRHLTARFGVKSDFSARLETSRDFIYPDGAVPGGITEKLTALEHSASFRWRAHNRLRILGQGRYRDYDKFNDENVSKQTEINILYGLYPSWPWVWAGVGAQRLTYDRQVPAYWSPEEFIAYGLRFDSSFPLGKRLSGSAAANLDKLDEDGSEGTGYYLQAGLQYRLYGELYARLDVVQSKSIQRSSTWTSDSVFFHLGGPLF